MINGETLRADELEGLEVNELKDGFNDVLEQAVGSAARAAYDAAYVTALKTARSVLKSTNAEMTLRALDDMISVFDSPTEAEEDDDEVEDKSRSDPAGDNIRAIAPAD